MKKYHLLLLLYFFNTAVHSQQIDQAVIASAGSIDKATGISLEWTLGETMVETLNTKDRLITQGFHQPLLLAKKFNSAGNAALSDYKVTIAPNPVQSYLRVAYSIPPAKDITLILSDFTGRIFSMQRTGEEN